MTRNEINSARKNAYAFQYEDLNEEIAMSDTVTISVGAAVCMLSRVKLSTNKIFGISIEEFCEKLLEENHITIDGIKETLNSFVITVGQYLGNDKLVVLGKEKGEDNYPCGYEDEIDFKYNLGMIIPNMQILPKLYDAEIEALKNTFNK